MTEPLVREYLSRAYSNLGQRSDKGTRHSYIEAYEKLFAPYRTTRPQVLEIGVHEGFSLALWRDYFQGGSISGVDIRPPAVFPTGCTVLIGDATKQDILSLLGPSYGIIIDDGSHRVMDQVRTFKLLRPLLAPGGIYVIEDIQSEDDRTIIQNSTKNCFEVIDRRWIKGRYDDVLMVHRG